MGTGRYLRLAFMPLLYVIIPITLLMVQLDRYLGSMPAQTSQPFLISVKTSPDVLNDVKLQLPDGLATSALPVHIPADGQVVWRVVAAKNGTYNVDIEAGGQSFSKQVVVSPDVERLSAVRLRDHLLDRWLSSGESKLPENGPIESIDVSYAPRDINFAWIDWNWIVLFFVLSMIAGFAFKEILGIEI
jgi:hypothetical protein